MGARRISSRHCSQDQGHSPLQVRDPSTLGARGSPHTTAPRLQRTPSSRSETPLPRVPGVASQLLQPGSRGLLLQWQDPSTLGARGSSAWHRSQTRGDSILQEWDPATLSAKGSSTGCFTQAPGHSPVQGRDPSILGAWKSSACCCSQDPGHSHLQGQDPSILDAWGSSECHSTQAPKASPLQGRNPSTLVLGGPQHDVSPRLKGTPPSRAKTLQPGIQGELSMPADRVDDTRPSRVETPPT